MSDDPLTMCEACEGHVERVLFAPAIHFKGSGFHNTDYGTKRRPVGADADGSSSKPADAAATGSDAGSTSSSSEGSSSSSSSTKTLGLDKV
jgi:predicted nucleic acid-binding Zn ribbon protein